MSDATNTAPPGKARDGFATKWGFILASIGSAVGMGNLWLFPWRVSEYGGGSFIIPYLIFVVIIGFSGVIGEMGFGRAAKAGPMGAFGMALEQRFGMRKLGEFLGFIPVLGCLALAIGYSVVVGWILKYTWGTFTGATWALEGPEGFGAEFGATASAWGNNVWQVLGLILVFSIMVAGIAAGIERANKIMMPLFFIMFIGLAIYVFFQDGASAGYAYIFTIDEKILDPQVWVFALGQAYFSLSLGGAGTLIYGSYLSDKEDIISSAKNVAIYDTLAAILAALVIIPAIATTGGVLSERGPGLLFIYLPNLFKTMPGGYIIMIIFFVAVTFAGVTSLINLFEPAIATLQEKLNMSRLVAVISIAVVALVVGLSIQGIVSNWMDVVSIYVLPFGAAMAGIVFFWVYGSKKVREELQKGRTAPIGGWLEPMTKYVFSILSVVVFLLGIVYGGIG